jgi:hypothetical protein
MIHERIQSEGAGLCANGQQTLHWIERHSGGLERKSMTESLKKEQHGKLVQL